MSESVQGTSTPVSKAMLLCDDVIVDERSKKKTLVGIFDNINSERFPAVHRSLKMYVRLIDAEGQYNFRLDYVQVKTDKLLGRAEIPPVTIAARLKVYELIIEPPPLQIPEPGEYEFRLWANNRYVGTVKFTAVEIAKRGA